MAGEHASRVPTCVAGAADTRRSEGQLGPAPGSDLLEARRRSAARAPWSMCLLFAALVLFTGRVPGLASKVLLVILAVALCRSRMAVPRSLAGIFALLLLATVGLQLVFDALSPADQTMSVVENVSPVYHVLYGFLVYAGLRSWEQGASREAILDRIEVAMIRWAPFIVVVLGITAVALVLQSAWLQREPARALLETHPDVLVATVVVVLPALRAADVGGQRLRTRALLVVWLVTVIIIAFRSRSSILALLVVLVLVQPRATRIVRSMFVVVFVLLALYVSGLSLDMGSRQLSFDAVMPSLTSFVSSDDSTAPGEFVVTRQWRQDWWNDIWDRVYAERMVVHGDGWGDHLGRRYNVKWFVDDTLSAPRHTHNIVLSLVAHGGLVVGALFLLTITVTVAGAHRQRRLQARSLVVEAALGGVVATFVAALMNPMLDVSIGAVLFWTLVGFLWWVSAPRADHAATVDRAQAG